uniref:Uncharacterized protein n=1 Tax=Ditylenchus dipsaci TaxID=166011 RepID=A0A915E4K5_9BILA
MNCTHPFLAVASPAIVVLPENVHHNTNHLCNNNNSMASGDCPHRQPELQLPKSPTHAPFSIELEVSTKSSQTVSTTPVHSPTIPLQSISLFVPNTGTYPVPHWNTTTTTTTTIAPVPGPECPKCCFCVYCSCKCPHTCKVTTTTSLPTPMPTYPCLP